MQNFTSELASFMVALQTSNRVQYHRSQLELTLEQQIALLTQIKATISSPVGSTVDSGPESPSEKASSEKQATQCINNLSRPKA